MDHKRVHRAQRRRHTRKRSQDKRCIGVPWSSICIKCKADPVASTKSLYTVSLEMSDSSSECCNGFVRSCKSHPFKTSLIWARTSSKIKNGAADICHFFFHFGHSNCFFTPNFVDTHKAIRLWIVIVRPHGLACFIKNFLQQVLGSGHNWIFRDKVDQFNEVA